MIVFDLACAQGHVFEGWFRDSAAFEMQKTDGDIVCPVCADCTVSKAPMAPHLATGGHGDEGHGQEEHGPEAETVSASIAALTAPRKSARDRRAREQVFHAPNGQSAPGKAAALAAEAARALRALRDEVKKSCDYVGENFAEEARKMHYGEAEQRSIYGETTIDEAKELRDEGIEIQPLPRLPRENA
jgi:hypothetical protein